MIDELTPLGIREMVRTGVVAMGRGVRIMDADYEPDYPLATATKAAGNFEAFSV